MRDLDSFYLNFKEPNQSCLLAVRSVILNLDQQVTETRKYGMPCFCYRGRMFCYLWVDKKSTEPYMLMVEGKYLDHPDLKKGNRSRMKVLRINPNKDLPVDTITLILNKALELYKNGTIVVK
jgi:hypothetical protein